MLQIEIYEDWRAQVRSQDGSHTSANRRAVDAEAQVSLIHNKTRDVKIAITSNLGK